MITPQTITANTIAAAAAAHYTVPAAVKKGQLKGISVTNSEAATAYTVTLYLVPNGGAPGVTNILVNAKSLAGGETWIVDEAENKVLATGGTLQALASVAAKLNLQGTVLEHT